MLTTTEVMLKGSKESYQKAIEDYDQAIEIDPKCAEAYNNRGQC